jgi:AbrB family looped-hinge helix DNA binding protein
MKITSKGQVTIPLRFRQKFGLKPDTHVEFISDGRELRLVKAKNDSGSGWRLVERMAGKGAGKMTTEQIMKLTRG